MILQASELFDEAGAIVSSCARWITGYQRSKAPLNGLKLVQQDIHVHQPVTIKEDVQEGVYFTFITKQDSLSAIQVQPVFQNRSVEWSVLQSKHFSWIQVFMGWEQLASVTGESISQAQHFFSKSLPEDPELPIMVAPTQALTKDFHCLMEHEGKQLSLIGKIYNVIFQIIEHMQISRHLSNCEGCQNKLLNGQNLLESEAKISNKQLAKNIGLTTTALEVGFVLMTNMTISEYRIEMAIRKALSQSSDGHSLAHRINADTGLTQQDIEKACLKRFGVMSHQLGSMQ